MEKIEIRWLSHLAQLETMMKRLLSFVIFLACSTSVFAETKIEDSLRLEKAMADQIAWKPVTYKGNNEVTICSNLIDHAKCRVVKIPQDVGQVEGISYGASNELPASWLAFSKDNVNLCIADGNDVKCAFVSRLKVRDVTISFDRLSPYPDIIFLSKPNNNDAVDEVANSLRKSINKTALSIQTGELVTREVPSICDDCEMTPMLEEPGEIPMVYITAAFPAVSIADGGRMFISVGFNDEYAGLPNPIPDGVSVADILKARDPKRMAGCTAAWYNVYLTMVAGCQRLIPGNMSAWSSCMHKSADAYEFNVKDDCYRNYF
jgi:hypothetical protein